MSISTKTTQKKASSSGAVFKKQAKTRTPAKQNSPAQDILNLHQTIGNRGVQRLFESGFIQGKLTVGEPNDKYEQEADRVADEVVRMPEPKVQRQSDGEEEKEETVQSKPIGEQITPIHRKEQNTEALDPSIEALNLASNTKRAAYILKKKHPIIIFNSGRRSLAKQAELMARNIVQSGNRRWITQTYSNTSSRRKLQKWVNTHPSATTVQALSQGLEEVLNSLTSRQQGYISKHLLGKAFDVHPVRQNANLIKRDIKALPGLTKFLDHEGGLVIWHAQFKRKNSKEPKDIFEQEADRIADEMIRMPESEVRRQSDEEEEKEEKLQTKPIGEQITPLVQREVKPEEEEKKKEIQTKTEGTTPQITSNLESRINALRGGGQTLPRETRAFFEPRFGRNFENVRVHTDATAGRLARSLNARAFTKGSDIVFGIGEYSPESSRGKRLLGHELTHVIQQNNKTKLIQSQRRITKRRRGKLNRIKVRGAENPESVYALMKRLEKRFPFLKGITMGYIKGNTLDYGYVHYPMQTVRDRPKDLMISSLLKGGVFLIKPISKSVLPSALRISGPAYQFYILTQRGNLIETDVKVAITGFHVDPQGVLVYVTRRICVPDLIVEARVPRNINKLTAKVLTLMGGYSFLFSPGITARNIVMVLKYAGINSKELMEILQKLKAKGRLGDFLNMIQIDLFRTYLKNMNIPWNFIFQNWEPSINDSGLLFAGFIVGAAENFYEAIRLIGVIVGSPFTVELAAERDQFFDAIKKFFEDPVTNLIKAVSQLYKTFMDKLWNLEFFDAGRILGNVVITILTLPAAFKSIPKLVKFFAKATVKAIKIGASMLRSLGLTVENLKTLIRIPSPYLVTPEGIILMASGDDVSVIDRLGKLIGKISKKDIDGLIKKLEDLEKKNTPKRGESPNPVAIPAATLEDVVRNAIASLKSQGVKGLRPSLYGTKLHAEIAKQFANSIFPKGWKVFTETNLKTIGGLSDDLADMKVRDYLILKRLLDQVKLPEKVLDSRVGGLVPDLVIRTSDKVLHIFDLTSQQNILHLSKTLLYGHILSSENVFVRFYESYWKLFTTTK